MDGFTGFKTATSRRATATRSRSWTPSTPSAWPGTRWTRAAVGSSRTYTATAAAPTTRCTGPGGPCTPVTTCSPTSRPRGLRALFAVEEHVEVEATWGIYQRMIGAYRHPDRAAEAAS